MGAHLIITNDISFKIAEEQNVVGIFKEDEGRKLSQKTRADIFADLSCIRINDYIFFHNVNKKGIIGVYKVIDLPFFDNTNLGFEKSAPYRFLIKPLEDLVFSNFVPEEIIFSDKNVSQKFKTIFYKKVLNRGKVCTHLLPEESSYLIDYLIKYNANNKSKNSIKNPYKKPKEANYIEPNFCKDDLPFRYEKELEWWLCYNIDKKDKCSLIIDDIKNIETFSNYMPLNIAGSNLDFLVLHHRTVENKTPRLRYKITIIELKAGVCRIEGLYEIEKYTRWVNENIANNEINIIQPVLIAYDYDKKVKQKNEYWNLSIRKPILLKYRKTDCNNLSLTNIE